MDQQSKVATKDLVMNEQQREAHQIGIGKETASYIMHSPIRTTYYTFFDASIKGVFNKNQISFSTDASSSATSPTHLVSSTIYQEIPALQVAPEYAGRIRIAWCHNLLHNIVVKGCFQIQNMEISPGDTISWDIKSQNYIDSSYWEQNQEDIGNIPELEKFHPFLPKTTLKMTIPWHFSSDISQAVPLFLFPERTTTQTFDLKNDIVDLLQFEGREGPDKPWLPIKPNQKFVIGQSIMGVLDNPSMICKFAIMTPEEKDFWYGKDHIYYIDDLISCPAVDKKETYGSEYEINNLACDFPIKVLHVVAENLEATKLHNYSNYSTNSRDVYQGYSPIGTLSLFYKTDYRIPETNPKLFTDTKFPMCPKEKGYVRYSFCDDPTSYDISPGIVLGNNQARIVVKLCNTNVYLHPVKVARENKPMEFIDKEDSKENLKEKKPQGPQPFFKVHVRLLATKKLTFAYNALKKCYDILLDGNVSTGDSKLDKQTK